MNHNIGPENQIRQADGIGGDRRGDRRYDIHLDLRWKLIRRRRLLANGVGHTLDMSSGGILFDAGRPLPVGLNVELSISWPVLLHNVAPLQLVVAGRIVRSDATRAAIQSVQHEFRTVSIENHRLPATTRPNTTSFLPDQNRMLALGNLR
jgi:hypothetical protein